MSGSALVTRPYHARTENTGYDKKLFSSALLPVDVRHFR